MKKPRRTELSRICRRLVGSNFADHVTWCRPTFLGETKGPFLGADLHGVVPGVAGGVKEGPRRVRRGCLDAAEHPAILAADGPSTHAAITCASAMAA